MSGCGSAYENCRLSAGFEGNRLSREMALDRCESVADREYAESVRQDEIRRQQEAQERAEEARSRAAARQRNARREAARQDVRRSPKVPDLGATRSESEAICREQGGTHSTQPGSESEPGVYCVCQVGEPVVYAGYIPADGSGFTAVKTFYEGRNVVDTRRIFEKEFGAADDVAVQGDYRVWYWARPTLAIYLSGYSGGVAITQRVPSDDREESAADSSQSTARQELFMSALQTVCNTGVVSAQRFLPSHPDAEGLLKRGYLSCQGALYRWKSDPTEVTTVESPIAFVCGYAVGAMFGKYGLAREIEGKLSHRAEAAARDCLTEVAKQGMTDAQLAALAASSAVTPQRHQRDTSRQFSSANE